jgi:1-deoxy-D-xylulose-5-phosphate reductoisomerase
VIAQFPDRLEVVALAAKRNGELLSEQAALHGVKRLALFDGPKDGPIPTGMESLLRLVEAPDIDVVVIAVAGVIGLQPTLRAIEAGKAIALASKEVLVSAGEHVMHEIRKKGLVLTPIDSEHSAIFQCMQGYRPDQVHRLILTASGGPFRGKHRSFLEGVTVQQALNHPTWNMGGKITIDSATLMNKALELIEAKWLFDLESDQIEVRVHPQSVIHSMVQFKDSSVLGQLGFPDMRLPIAYALLYPERLPNQLPMWDPLDTPNLAFEAVDETAFPSIQMARDALNAGGTTPAVFNAANEEAANAFLRGELKFLDIYKVVGETAAHFAPEPASLEAIIDGDSRSRQFARNLIEGLTS